MKLIDRLNRTYFRLAAAMLAGGVLLIYLFIHDVVQDEMDEKLAVQLERIKTKLSTDETLPQLPPVIETRRLPSPAPAEYRLSDTVLYDPAEQEAEPFRQLTAVVETRGQFYAIRVRSPRVEAHDFLIAILIPVVLLLVLLVGGLFWLNRGVLRALWRPFYHTLQELKHFSLTQPKPVALYQAGIAEFDELNAIALRLTEKNRADYQNLKEFTENASHEIQTPLAIIRAKTEGVMQTEQLPPELTAAVQAIYRAANRLSRINQGLLLLAKIENQQFPVTGQVSFNRVIREHLDLLAEMIGAKGLRIDLQLSEEMFARIHPELAEILVKNLLENALRYSPPGSLISIATTGQGLVIANPGETLANPEQLFRRFGKRDHPSASPGLGLAIVRKICDVHGLLINYAYQNGLHRFDLHIPT